jgi:elongation factor Ts
MSEITAGDVKKLRDLTGAGMMDCKKALTEANGDMDAAIDYLRKKGAKVAELRAGRDANEGVVIIKIADDKKRGIVVLLGCETDFVAKNESFIEFADSIASKALSSGVSSVEELLNQEIDGATIQERVNEKVATIGEIISIQDFKVISGAYVASYNHNNKVGVILSMDKSHTADLEQLGKDVCMQIAAMKPVALDETSVTEDQKQREMAVAREKAIADGKPENMIEKIAEGALKKFYKEFTLMSQEFVKDTKKTIADVVKATDAEVKITGFERVELGTK